MYTEYWQSVRLVKLDQGISEENRPIRLELSDDWHKKVTIAVKKLDLAVLDEVIFNNHSGRSVHSLPKIGHDATGLKHGSRSMQLIYIHGLNSNHLSPKGQWISNWCAKHRPDITVRCPDLNLPPKQVMALLGEWIAQDPHTAVVGSSLGGFFATACVAVHDVRAVLINPSVRPFESLQRFFRQGQAEHTTETGWRMTPDQLDDLAAYYQAVPVHADQILVLLKQGDEVIDYRIAEAYFSQSGAQSPMIIEPDGDHFMSDMADKIPLMIDFLFAPVRA